VNHPHAIRQDAAHRNAAGYLWCCASLGYDALNRQTSGVGADWHPWNSVYDEVDRVTRSTDSVGQMRDYLYDHNGNAIGENLRLGNSLADTTTHAYDLADRRISTTNAGGFRSLFEYDGTGNIIRVQNPDNYTVRFDYDAGNKVIKAYDEAGNAVTRTLDVDGKPRTVTDPNGNVTTYTYYDTIQDGRLSTVTLPKIQDFTAGRQSKVDYDANGNVIRSYVLGSCNIASHQGYKAVNVSKYKFLFSS
jgi:YD repeat-containing protein